MGLVLHDNLFATVKTFTCDISVPEWCKRIKTFPVAEPFQEILRFLFP